MNEEHQEKGHPRGDHDKEPHHDDEHSHHEHPLHEHRGSEKPRIDKYLPVIAAVLFLILVFNMVTMYGIDREIDSLLQKKAEREKPAKISVTLLKDEKCSQCFDTTQMMSSLKQKNVDIQKEDELRFQDAAQLISQYQIRRIPAVIVTGEGDKISLAEFKQSGDALVFDAPGAPYTDAESGAIVGKVTLTSIVKKDCTTCHDVGSFVASLESAGVLVEKQRVLDVADASDLIEKYGIQRAPVVIASSGLAAYPEIVSAWSSIGKIASDGSYITTGTSRPFNPPYYDLESKKVVGLVTLTYLDDKTCSQCYNVSLHRSILADSRGLDVAVNKEVYLDISDPEGEKIVKKYDILQVPTIVLSADIGYYDDVVYSPGQTFSDIWQGVGTVEPDGAYVFRNVDVMQAPYRNLTSGEVMGIG